MQPEILYTEQLIPEKERAILGDLKDQIGKSWKAAGKPVLGLASENLNIIRSVLSALKERTLASPFLSPGEEILFFKVVKPHFHAFLVEWTLIFDLELRRPLGGRKAGEKYLRKELRRLRLFFERHAAFFIYYRSGKNELDGEYFLRAKSAGDNIFYNQDLDADPQYRTDKDALVGKLLGYERFQRYLEKELKDLKAVVDADSLSPVRRPVLQWTASKASLVELIYALHAGGVYNNGDADIKLIANQFEELFEIELSNFYNVFNEIRLRKKSRTQLLDTLKEKVIRKMDEMDEK